MVTIDPDPGAPPLTALQDALLRWVTSTGATSRGGGPGTRGRCSSVS